MAENLDQFFDSTQGHTKSAQFKTSANVNIGSAVDVIFNGPTGNVDLNDGVQFEAVQPFLLCRTTHLSGVDHSSKVTIGAITYRIVNDLHDGEGISTVFLKK
jgi:hypothetical protein